MATYKLIDPETEEVVGELVGDVTAWAGDDAKLLKLVRVSDEGSPLATIGWIHPYKGSSVASHDDARPTA